MRIAAMVLGLMLAAWTFFEAFLIAVLSNSGSEMSAAAGLGLIGSLCAGLAAGVALPAPRFSAILFVVAGGISFLAAGVGYGNHAVYGVLFFLLAVMAFLGWRGKVKASREIAAERQRQAERDDRLEALLASRDHGSILCPSCNRLNPPATRYCGNCGTALDASRTPTITSVP